MKRSLFFRVIAVLIVSLACPLPLCRGAVKLSPGEEEYLRRKGEIVFISQTRYSPFEFIDRDGQPVGMMIDLAGWMAGELGFRARFRDTSFQKAQEAVLSGEADVLTSLFHSEKRARLFNFTRTIFRVPASIFVAAGRTDIAGIDDLRGKKIAMQSGDYAKEFLDSRGISCDVIWAKDFGEATDLVAAGRADAIIGDEQIVIYHVFSQGLTEKIKMVGEPLYVGRNCMATSEENRILAGILDKAVAGAEEAGVLAKISQKWLGTRDGRPTDWLLRRLPYLIVTSAAVLLIILLTWLWNFRLRQTVGRRTAELKRSEARLAYLSLAVESLGEMVIVTNLDHVITYANAAVRQALGYSPGEMIDHPASEFFDGIPGNPPCLREHIRESGENVVWRGELFNLRKDGGIIRVYLTLAWLRDPEGKIIGTVGVSIDVTERRELEEQLRHSQKLEAVGTLAGGIAHDFNNILAGALGYLSLIKECLPEIPGAGRFSSKIDSVEKLLWRGSDLTGALLAFSRKGTYRPAPLDVNRAIREVLTMIERTAGKNIELVAELPPDVMSILGDRSQVYQVIMNLCLNACEAMPAGGRLTVSTRNTDPADRIFRLHPDLGKKPCVAVAFADTGTGFGREMRERIFEPFFSTKEDKTGVGLGLSVVSGIVERHGGCIEVESEEGRGSVFRVYLPAIDQEEILPPEPPENPPGGQETILVVDDNPDFRKVIGDTLEKLGYTVIQSVNGREALRILEREGDAIDLVLLDMIMKGLSGPETFRRMRDMHPELPVLICTGWARDPVVGRMIREDRCGFIQKPFPHGDLAEEIRKLLDGSLPEDRPA
ncbi:MAG: transporter substrate-binding domain-containing protein [PVC group bacterium]